MIATNPGTTSLRPPTATPFYTQPQQPPVDYDYKQQTSGAHIYNYLSMVPPTTSNFIHQQQQQQQLHSQPTSVVGPNQVPSQHGAGMPLPILVQQPSGQIQYIFPAHALQQQQQQPPPPSNPYPLSPEGQYVPVNIQNKFSYIINNKLYSFCFYSFIDKMLYPYRVHQHQLLTVIIPITTHTLKINLIIIIPSLNNNSNNSNNQYHRHNSNKSHHLSQILHHNLHLLFDYIQQEHQAMFHIHMLNQLINNHLHHKQHMFNHPI